LVAVQTLSLKTWQSIVVEIYRHVIVCVYMPGFVAVPITYCLTIQPFMLCLP